MGKTKKKSGKEKDKVGDGEGDGKIYLWFMSLLIVSGVEGLDVLIKKCIVSGVVYKFR